MKKEHNYIRQYLNKGISTTAGILIVVSVAIVAGGIITWQMWPEEEVPSPPPIVSPTPTTTPTPSPTPTTTPSPNPSPTPSPTTPETYIKVGSPVVGQKISSPVVISGNSDTFEANVRIRIKDNNGNVLADTFTMGGSYGEMKPFSTEVSYDSPSAQTGVIEVFEDSPKDGAEINKITVSVIFQDYSDETADWKIYRNETFGFEMRHPENWRLLQGADIISFQPPFSDLYFNIDKVSSHSTVKEFLEGIDSDAISLIEQKNIQVDGRTAIQRNTSYSRAPEGEDSWTTYIEDSIEQGYSITIIRLVGRPEVMNETIVSLYNQILSTFKFID